MPLKPPTACRASGCHEITRERYCPAHQHLEKEQAKQYDQQREHNPFYHSTAWEKAKRMYGRQHPLCEQCLAQGRIVPKKIVHHKTDIKEGGAKLDPANFESLCQECHNRETGKQRKERGKND